MRKFHPLAVAAEQNGKKIYHLNIGQPDLETPPTYYETIRNFNRKTLAYDASPGNPELIRAVQNYYAGLGVDLEPRDILITTGGSDSFNLAGQLLMEAMKYDALKEKEYHVVSGSLNLHIGELQALAQKHENIHIHCNVTNMAELMAESEIALSAGGSTLYELCAMGVPVIAFSFAENQERLVQTFVKRGIAQYGGNYRTDGNKMIQNTIAGLETLLEDENLRTKYREKARTLVDGKGAGRIAEAILSC